MSQISISYRRDDCDSYATGDASPAPSPTRVGSPPSSIPSLPGAVPFRENRPFNLCNRMLVCRGMIQHQPFELGIVIQVLQSSGDHSFGTDSIVYQFNRIA